MKRNDKVFYLLSIITVVAIVFSLFLKNTYITILFFGVYQLFSGLKDIKGSKTLGVISILIGLGMIISCTIKLAF